MKPQIFLLFSADYELFFGENYLSERDVLIRPTDQLLKGCGGEGIPVTLFADVASVWRYQFLRLDSDYPFLFENQLCQAIRSIHDVQLHLHPHWMTSEFDGKKWTMDEARFLLSGVGYGRSSHPDLDSAEALILKGKNYLEKLLRPVDSSYNCVAFRAGGFGIQPKDREFFGALQSAHFKIDSSIAPGMVFMSKVNQIDFRRVPSKANYRLSSRNGLAMEDSEGIFEIPEVTYKKSLPFLLKQLMRRISKNKEQFPQRGRQIQAMTTTSLVKGVLWQIFHPLSVIELSGSINVDHSVKSTDAFIKKHLRDSSAVYFALSCHPKNVFPATIKGILKFWNRMVSIYGPQIKAITFQEAAMKI